MEEEKINCKKVYSRCYSMPEDINLSEFIDEKCRQLEEELLVIYGFINYAEISKRDKQVICLDFYHCEPL